LCWAKPAQAFVARYGEAQGACERLEHGLDLMMRGAAVERAQMNVGFCRCANPWKKSSTSSAWKIADAFCRDLRIHDAVRPSAKIQAAQRVFRPWAS